LSAHPSRSEGCVRFRIGINCRCRPRRQTATISSASFRSTRSTWAGIPRISVLNGQVKVLLKHREQADALFRFSAGVDDGSLNELVKLTFVEPLRRVPL